MWVSLKKWKSEVNNETQHFGGKIGCLNFTSQSNIFNCLAYIH